jgi:hypothetical protein
MATRPIFIPINEFPFVNEQTVEFQWFPGFSKTQAQKSIRSLHRAAKTIGIYPVLEISSKSSLSMGVELSAFNLMAEFENGYRMSVECAFQGSKVFEKGGPYQDLYKMGSYEAKKDKRLKDSGDVIGFQLFDDRFPTEPKTAFYDWLYLKALSQNPVYAKMLSKFEAFSDIHFNPEKSINCQARAAALFVSLQKKWEIDAVINDKTLYFSIISGHKGEIHEGKALIEQYELPFNYEGDEIP